MVPHMSEGRIYFLASDDFGQTYNLKVYDPSTFIQMAVYPLPNLFLPGRLVEWQKDHLAFRAGDDQIYTVDVSPASLRALAFPSVSGYRRTYTTGNVLA